MDWLSFKVLIAVIALFASSPSYSGNWGDVLLQSIGGAAAEMSRQLEQQAEIERQVEAQRRLLEYRYELETKRLEAERARDELRREQELKSRLADEERQKREAVEERKRALSTGTGFFVTPNGYIITNHHVIEEKTHFAIRDLQGDFYRATVVAQDANRDLALLKIAGKFPSLKITRPDSVSKGQRVMTVGYPQISIQGNESKVTDGVVSSFSGLNNDQNWFQISTPIQGGNSGGPLVTESGDVVGVVVATANAAKFFKVTGNIPQNVNYAIKSNMLLGFLAEQNVANVPSRTGKTSIDWVDSATVLVIAKGDPIDVSYSISPEQRAAQEKERVKAAAEVAKRVKPEQAAEKKSRQHKAQQIAEQRSGEGAIRSQAPPDESFHTQGQTFRDCPECPEMVEIPAGKFDMGSNDGGPYEKPVRSVGVPTFALARTEVTQDQWRALMNSDGHFYSYTDPLRSCGGDCPVRVDWFDAKRYLIKLSKKTGQRYRLPSEAEWEYACRSGGRHNTYCGSDNIESIAWFDRNSNDKPHPVGLLKPNAFGLYDMSGNTWEWAEDCANSDYTNAPVDGSAWVTGECDKRIIRGGTWDQSTRMANATNRVWYRPDTPLGGIRPARMMP